MGGGRGASRKSKAKDVELRKITIFFVNLYNTILDPKNNVPTVLFQPLPLALLKI